MKQLYILIIALLSMTSTAYSQNSIESQEMQSAKASKARLEAEIKAKTDSLSAVNALIIRMEGEAFMTSLQDSEGRTAIPATVSLKGSIREEASPMAATLASVSPGDVIILLSYSNDYWLVKAGEHIGYINDLFITHNEQSKAFKAITVQKDNKATSTGYKSSSSSYKPSTSSSTRPSASKTIHTGPRGGQYYINSKGNKTYIKRK